MSDNELDNLFKEAAEGFTPPQDQHAWKQMASMLDQHAVNTAGFWNWKTISSVTLAGLIAVTATWYGLTTHENTISKTDEKNGVSNAIQSVVQEQKELPTASGTTATGEENFAAAQSVESKSSRTRAISENESHVSPSINQNNVGLSGDNGNTGNTVSSETLAGHKPEMNVPESPVEANTEDQFQRARISENSETATAADSVQPEPEELKADSVFTAKASDPQETKEEKIKSGAGISLKAVISPDFSSVNFFSASKPGVNYGLLAGYSFNNRWSVYTGVIYSKKLYTSTEIEESYSSNGHDYPVKELEGDCRILDIPINVYYTFFPERNFSLRAGLGFSSYIMRKEDYVYCVDNYGNDLYYEQQVRGKNNEWFKVMNVSVMVSKKLTPRLSAEFEPFVKAPLAGVGEGKVSLVSMGAFINVKFDFARTK